LVVLGVFAILGLLFNVQIDALFITALLTVIGFSVHDTIVVFDRIRENLAHHSDDSFEHVVDYSLAQTLVRSLNTSLTVVFTLLALVLFGGGSTRLFVLALLIGIISGTYSSIFNASQLLVAWENGEIQQLFRRITRREPRPATP
jgi:preprotein translocase subunit SecF